MVCLMMPDQEQSGVQYLNQGYFDIGCSGVFITNLLIYGGPQCCETQCCGSEPNIPQET